MSMNVQKLIDKHDSDIRQFRSMITRLTGQQGTRAAIGNLEFRIAAAEKSKAILRAAANAQRT